MRVITITLLGLAACGAAEPRPERFEIHLLALESSGKSLADVRFWADGKQLGVSDASGRLRVELAGYEGQPVALSTACPPGYRTLEPQRSLVLRRVQRGKEAVASLELRATCTTLERTVALVVRASGPSSAGLPIRVRGEVIGQTDSDGLAHLLLKSRPQMTLRVTIDTSSQPSLRPRDPVHTFEVADADAVVLIEQPFERAVARVRKARPAGPAPKLPYRID
jgi:hypothetical protein